MAAQAQLDAGSPILVGLAWSGRNRPPWPRLLGSPSTSSCDVRCMHLNSQLEKSSSEERSAVRPANWPGVEQL